MNRAHSVVFALAATLIFAAASARALPDAEAATGRALVKRFADSVVGVELVVTLKVKMGDREAPPSERRIEVNGTVISATGLTVVSLAEVDPQAAFDAIRMSQGGGGRIELVGADFKEVKLRLADGSEVPARFVLKDADLDLAFMAPELEAGATPREFPHVNLEENANGAVLGSYFYVARAPKVLQRVPLVRASEIMGMLEKPRRYYLMTELSLGTPMFDAQGRVLGITLQHFANGRRSGFVVLPAVDIIDIARQATAARTAAPTDLNQRK